jgi:hypothetical protein
VHAGRVRRRLLPAGGRFYETVSAVVYG